MFKPTISESDPFSDNMLKLNWTQKVWYIKWGEERWVVVPEKQNTIMSQPHWLVWLGFWQTSWVVRTDANYISDGFEAATEEDDPHAKSFLLLLSHETIRSTNRDELYMMRLWAHSIGAFRDPIPSWDSQPLPKKKTFTLWGLKYFLQLKTSSQAACQLGTGCASLVHNVLQYKVSTKLVLLTFYPSPHEWELLGK